MKQLEISQKQIGEYVFFLKPFPAFVAANISGDLTAALTPVLSSLAPVIASGHKNSVMDFELEEVLPHISAAFSGLSGDKLESLMRKLLIVNKNISVEGEATDGETKLLTMDLANEVFCRDIQDMYILCFEVIRLNFGGFFSKIAEKYRDSVKTAS